jgi:hypothetical protein
MVFAPVPTTAAWRHQDARSGLAVQRLEQTYLRTAGDFTRQRYDYAAPAFDFTCSLVYDESGLVLDYPGIATRAG